MEAHRHRISEIPTHFSNSQVINEEQELLKIKPNFISCIPGNEPAQCRPGQQQPPLKTREELDSALKGRTALTKAHLQHRWVNRVTSLNPGIFLV